MSGGEGGSCEERAGNAVFIIPARAGSKRIPNKNIRLFAGRPIIAHSIGAALASGLADRVIVSTDSEQISEVACSAGAEVPFFRPADLADDHTGTDAVVLHALEELERQDYVPEFVCCLYPTAPLVQTGYLRQGYEIVRKGEASSAVSVAPFPFPIWRALCRRDDGFLEPIWPEHQASRSQDLPEAYQDAGQFYWARVPAFRESRRFMMSATAPVVLPRYLVQDIDTPEDWLTAELLFSVFGQREEPVTD